MSVCACVAVKKTLAAVGLPRLCSLYLSFQGHHYRFGLINFNPHMCTHTHAYVQTHEASSPLYLRSPSSPLYLRPPHRSPPALFFQDAPANASAYFHPLSVREEDLPAPEGTTGTENRQRMAVSVCARVRAAVHALIWPPVS